MNIQLVMCRHGLNSKKQFNFKTKLLLLVSFCIFIETRCTTGNQDVTLGGKAYVCGAFVQ